ncbi:uncharacterized protein L199_006896 [Kwoniella botswanensis]|uniref:uncharacterized protein n=1 Tax=Kwoniella botswanensis TaxID=1268659 RepID=UPI00315C5FF5
MSGAASPIAGPVLSKFHPVRRLDILPRPAVAQSGLEDDHQSARSALSSSGNKGQLPSGTWGDEAECATPSGTADTHPIGRYGTVDHGLSAPSVSPGMADMTALDGLWLQIDEILGIPYTTPATSFAAEWLADGGQEDLTAANSDFQPVFHFSL